MASVMRAMSFGSTGSSKSSATQQPPENEDGLSLSRQTSRLQPPYVVGSPTGILINPLRVTSAPSSPPAAAPIYNHPSAGSSEASINLPRILSGSDIANRSSYASSLASVPSSPTDERGRSISNDSETRGTSHSRPAMPTTILSDTGLTKIESLENRKIRFAPLPEIHGRDGEWDVAGIEDLTADELTRSQSAGMVYERHHMHDEDDDDDDDERDQSSRMGSMFGSWKSDNSFGGRRSADDEDRSVTSKLLRPLSFGLVGGSKKKARSSSKGRSGTSAESLARVSSNESDLSRGSSMEGGFKSTGVPMRKTRTWESNDSSEGGKPARESRRAQYPPVAQRSRTARRPMSISAPEPAFNEWGSSGSVGSVAASRSSNNEDEDDGGGMAWIKKRRAQREAERKAAEEEAARKAKEEEEAAERGEDDLGGEGDDAEVPFALDEDDAGDTTMEKAATPQGDRTPALSVVTVTGGEQRRGSNASTPAISTTPKTQHSLLGMTRPTLNIATASADASPSLNGAKGFDHNPPSASPLPMDSPMSIGTPPRDPLGDNGDDQGHAQRLSDKLGKLAIGGRATAFKGPASPIDLEDDSDEDEEDDDDDDEDNSDNDSDLDEEELREEEALVEQARITAKSAGAERFHTAKHQSSVVEVEGRRPAPNRQSTITQPSRQNTLTQPPQPQRQNTIPSSRQSTL